MACASCVTHTITLSDDGIVHSFGRNDNGQLGLGHYNDVYLPTPILNLPQIKEVSCGWNFTICVDIEGFIWSFGENKWGQLGTGNKTNFNVPQKICNIPPVLSVACGTHTLIITIDDNLWSCGNGEYGQLCLGNSEDHSTFQQTKFSHITRVSVGAYHSLFQDIKGEIYSCGRNDNGQLGLGHDNFQITPSLIPNLPSNIVQFICGSFHNLFLDSEGNVYNRTQNVLDQIQNIPPIQSISCGSFSSYLIDMEGNLWSFGNNDKEQLGLGDTKNRNIPTKIENFKDIQRVSYGSCGIYFFAKDSQNKIFAIGDYCDTQLVIPGYIGLLKRSCKSNPIPKELNSKYFTIWGDIPKSNAKSARK